jgi:hypothetical protein
LPNNCDKNFLSNEAACIQKDDKLLSPSLAEVKVASPSDMDMEDNNVEYNIGKEISDLTATSPYKKSSDHIKCSYKGLLFDDKEDLPFLEKGRSINDTIFDFLLLEDIKLVSTVSIT